VLSKHTLLDQCAQRKKRGWNIGAEFYRRGSVRTEFYFFPLLEVSLTRMAHTEHSTYWSAQYLNSPCTAGSGFVLRGNGYYHSHQYDKALEAYKTALEKETLPIARWNIHNRLCATYTKLQDYENALREAELMIESDPEHPKGYVRKGGSFYFRGEYDLALEEYAKGIQ
jgi:tetratricopeptide (TPR) repeat protein